MTQDIYTQFVRELKFEPKPCNAIGWQFLHDLDTDLHALVLEEESIRRRLHSNGCDGNSHYLVSSRLANGHSHDLGTGSPHSDLDLDSHLADTIRRRQAVGRCRYS